MIVMKFGGSSIADSERMKNVARIITENLKKKPFVVISGIGGITDELIAIGKAAASGKSYAKMCGKVRKRHADMLGGLGLDASLLGEEMLLLENLPKAIERNGTLNPGYRGTLIKKRHRNFKESGFDNKQERNDAVRDNF